MSEDIWTQTKNELRNQMAEATYNNLIADTWLISQTGDTYTVGVKTDKAKDWIKNRLNGVVERVLASIVGGPVVGGPVRVIIEVDENGPPDSDPLPLSDDPLPPKFSGFGEPQENWSKLPHALIAAFPQIESRSELMVILYILRHTWGYHEEERRISLDEFRNGRKRRNGERIDNGTGLSINAVKKGIKKAIDHGFITVDIDHRDGGRKKQYYSLNT